MNKHYCPKSQAEHRRVARKTDDPPLPAEPTLAMPGTDEKIDVLAARFISGKSLWHPEDDLWTRRNGN